MSDHHTIAERVGTGPSRRTFLGYVIAGATLVTGAEMGLGTESAEAVSCASLRAWRSAVSRSSSA